MHAIGSEKNDMIKASPHMSSRFYTLAARISSIVDIVSLHR